MAKLIKHMTLDAAAMLLDSPYQDGDFDATKVKKFVEVAPGVDSVWVHGLERVPNHIEIVYSDRALNYPEIVSRSVNDVVLRFVPDWVSNYTSRKFNIILRFA